MTAPVNGLCSAWATVDDCCCPAGSTDPGLYAQMLAVASYVRSGSAGTSDLGLDPNHDTSAQAAQVLPRMAPFDQVIADYQATGLSLKGHPVGFYRAQLDQLQVTQAKQLSELTHGDPVIVAGIVLLLLITAMSGALGYF